ncbi:MAG: TIGR03087 family PEP-CTERM/XrtA system glycosyltransferase [Phycisphaerales bacterium]|nr:TIGR03087 family PEP-CTERM/XrtA system glycosyltransferase [Phycisphaerales bacterium]
MDILYLAHRIPYPPDKGDKLRAFRQIERLSKRHRVWCACFVDTPSDFRHVVALREFCEDVAAVELRPMYARVRGLWKLIRGGTITEGFYESREMRDVLRRWTKVMHFDAVVAFSSSMAPYGLSVPSSRRVLDLCDRDSRKWLDYADHGHGVARRLFRLEGERLAVCELRWIDVFDAAILITETEAAPLREFVATRKLHIIGNGVTLPTLTSAKATIRPTVGFVGVMDYLPNIDAVSWFVRECWPLIRSVHPTAVFRIVGRSPVGSVHRLGRLPGVQVVGGVEDIGAELQGFDVSVAPLRIARGIQNKVLEAMAAAKPVVLTSKAAAGIGAEDGRDYLVHDTPAAIAGAVRDLLADPSARQRIGDSARRFVAEHNRWDEQMDQYELLVTGARERSTPARKTHLELPVLRAANPHRTTACGASQSEPRP